MNGKDRSSGIIPQVNLGLNTISEDDDNLNNGSFVSGSSHRNVIMFSEDTKNDDDDGHQKESEHSSSSGKKMDSIFNKKNQRASFSQECRSRISSISHDSRRRLQSVSHSARKSLAFDINDEGKREKLAHRRMSHLSKFSSLKKSQTEEVLRRVSIDKTDIDLSAPFIKGRKDSAAAVLFKVGASKLSARPNLHIPTWDAYGGRSFLPSDLDDITDSDYVDDNIIDSDDFAFFDFMNMQDIKDNPIAGTGLTDVIDTTRCNVNVDKTDSLKRGKAKLTEKTRAKKKAWFLFGTLLNRKFKNKLSNKLKYQFDDQREYFTTWLSLVQVAIMITVMCIYPSAPIGKSSRYIEKEVLLSREGILHLEKINRKVVESIWFGPSLEDLILLGAKYAPCMRRDNRVYAEVEKERKNENNTGCCMQTIADGCLQRESKYCITPSVEFKPKSVCGQDPKYCIRSSKASRLWDLNTITDWPKCEKSVKKIDPINNRHMTCEITGRPCCINTQGQCVITTQDNCKFWNGMYHSDANLCSQVDCIATTCGNSFATDDRPDQIHRLFLSLFLCAGFAHLAVILIFNFTILRDIEGYAGCFRTALIFLLSGAGGNLWSSVWLPYQVQVGESGALFGIFACVFVEGIQNWSLLEKPMHYMSKLIGMLFVMIAFGTLPYIDNFAHVFGFIYGLLLGFIILPNVATTEDEVELQKEINRYIVLRILAVTLVAGLTVAGFILFYQCQYTHSDAIAFFNCPFSENFCENYHQGQQLEPREIEY